MPPPEYRLVQIVTQLELGGAQEQVLETLRHFTGLGVRCYLITGPGGYLFPAAASLSLERHFVVEELRRTIRPFRELAALLKIRRILKRLSMDGVTLIVHTNSSKAGVVGRLAAWRLQNVKVVHTVHGFGFNPLQGRIVNGFFFHLEKMCGSFTDHVVCVSSRNHEFGIRHRLFKSSRSSVIRSGVDIGPFSGGLSAGARARLGLEAGDFVLLSLSCFKPQKDPLGLIEIFHRVKRSVNVKEGIEAAKLVILGDGELRTDMERRIDFYGLRGQVLLPGWRGNVPEWLSCADLFLMCSRHEGLPRSCVQAAASGLPQVVSDVDGFPEIVRQGETGILCAPGDYASFAEAIVKLYHDKALYGRFKANSRQRLDVFTREKMLADLEKLYWNLL